MFIFHFDFFIRCSLITDHRLLITALSTFLPPSSGPPALNSPGGCDMTHTPVGQRNSADTKDIWQND